MTELVKRKELPKLTEEYEIVEMEKEKAKAEILAIMRYNAIKNRHTGKTMWRLKKLDR